MGLLSRLAGAVTGGKKSGVERDRRDRERSLEKERKNNR